MTLIRINHFDDFENRISGGEWTDYRKNLEDAGETSAWADFVQITDFDQMLSDLMTQWAFHGATMDEEACRPPEFGSRISGAQWSEYASRVSDCSDETWRDLLKVTELMHDRIHHMMHAVMIHDVEAHDGESENKEFLE